MKYRLPILTVVVTVALFGLLNQEKARVVLSLIRSQDAKSSDSPEPKSSSAGPPSQLLAESQRTLRQVPALESKLRVRVEMLGHSLSGVGSYLQLAGDDAIRSRLELKMQVADRVASLLQVNDGRFSWLRDDLDRDPRLVRIDLRRLREESSGTDSRLTGGAVEDKSGAGQGRESEELEFVAAGEPSLLDRVHQGTRESTLRRPWALLGGLPRLICDLDDNFEFEAPRETRRGDIPVWVIQGRWRAEALARLLPNQRQRIVDGQPLLNTQVPPFVPHAVRLTLGRDDALPGFPYLIEFLRTEGRSWQPRQATESEQLALMVSMEIYEARVPREIDASLFKYNPANQDVVDRTEELLGHRGGKTTR